MKRRLLLLLIAIFVFPAFSDGQNDTVPVTYLTIDSIVRGYAFEEHWLFTEDDSITFAQPSHDDSNWKLINASRFRRGDDEQHSSFQGKGWFRLHINADSSVADIPISLTIGHYGASEIYLDGKKLNTYGSIKGKTNSEYYNPQRIPLIVNLKAGQHVLAVKYANYHATLNYQLHQEADAGFTIVARMANTAIEETITNNTVLITISIFAFSFFLAFFFLHIIIYLYNKKETANLYFSMFCFSMAILFLSPYLRIAISAPHANMSMPHMVLIGVSGMCISLSGFLNQLFGRNKILYKIIAIAGAASIIGWLFNHTIGGIICFLIVVTTCLEASVLIIRALARKEKGAFIIGFSLLILILTIIIIIIAAQLLQTSVNLGVGFGIAMLLVILSIPVSMSIYLSKNYSYAHKSLAVQLKQVEELSARNMEQELEKQKMLENKREELEKEVEVRTSELTAQKQKSDDLLLNILPEEVAEELKEKGTSAAKYFDHVSVLFTDFVDFTKAGERLTPQQLVDELHTCFKKFDEICSKYNIEKIKTIGDAYLAVSGLPMSDEEHAISITKAAIEIREFIRQRKEERPETSFNIRIGIHSGSVVAGIVGVKKFAYDIWGDTVNTAARMEQSSELGKINISQFTYELVKDQFICTFRGKITAKNKGELNMYFVEGQQ